MDIKELSALRLELVRVSVSHRPNLSPEQVIECCEKYEAYLLKAAPVVDLVEKKVTGRKK